MAHQTVGYKYMYQRKSYTERCRWSELMDMSLLREVVQISEQLTKVKHVTKFPNIIILSLYILTSGIRLKYIISYGRSMIRYSSDELSPLLCYSSDVVHAFWCLAGSGTKPNC